jgi:receptor protein-tyrosine kinase
MLRWFDAESTHKSLSIVSPSTGDGRSFVAANLAVVFSQLGERTLLIDADLRNPRQHQLFKTSNSFGLSSILAGRTSPNIAVAKIESMLDLSVVPAGATPPNPQELLSRDAFPEMLNEYSQHYDVIIIDTPAAELSADAQTISSRAGAALMVASKNATHVTALQTLAANLNSSNVTIVGSLLNDK